MRTCVALLTLLVVVPTIGCGGQKSAGERQAAGELSSRDPKVAQAAADRLANLGPQAAPAVPQLATALASSDAELRWRAALALECVGPDAASAVPALVKALQDKDPNVQAHAAHALGQIGVNSSSVVDGLAGHIAAADPVVRRAVISALGRLHPDPKTTIPLMVTALEDADPAVVMPALQTLAEGGAESVPALIEALEHPKGRYWATLVLTEMGPAAKDAVPALSKSLADKDPEVRMQSVMALGAIGPEAKGATPLLVAGLDDSTVGVRYASAFALGAIGAPEAIAALEKAEGDNDPFIAMVAAWAVAKSKPEDAAATAKAVEKIIAALKHDDARVRLGAARALLELNAPRDIVGPALLAAMNDANPEVQENVYRALASLGEEVVPKVVEGLKDPAMHDKAVRVLGLMGSQAKTAVPHLIEALGSADAAHQRPLIFALAHMGPDAAEATPPLIKALSSADEDVRVAAAIALGGIGPAASAAVDALQKSLDASDSVLRLVSAEALLKIEPQDEKILQQVITVLTNLVAKGETDVTRSEAAAALGDIGPVAKSALPTLKKALTDESPTVREAAQETIKKIGK